MKYFSQGKTCEYLRTKNSLRNEDSWGGKKRKELEKEGPPYVEGVQEGGRAWVRLSDCALELSVMRMSCICAIPVVAT